MVLNDEVHLFDGKEYTLNNESEFKLKVMTDEENLIKSKERVKHHGEVFTPKWMVKKMLSDPTVQEKIKDIHAIFFEPSAGEGAFLKEILHQKLNYVDEISNKTNWKENALWALMSIYGIELLVDNLKKARASMIEVFINHYQAKMKHQLSTNSDLYKSVKYVIEVNIVQGNTLKYKNNQGELIKFSHWIPVGKQVQREEFSYKSLLNNGDSDDVNAEIGQLSLFGTEDDNLEDKYKVCLLTKVYKEEKING